MERRNEQKQERQQKAGVHDSVIIEEMGKGKLTAHVKAAG
jgi:hypothetical protein